ncbi:MAG TPA: NADH-quinone oxidoreductase subunit A [bacterium]
MNDASIQPVYMQYSWVLTFGIGALAFAMIGLGLAKLIRYSHPGGKKDSIYECAEEPVGSARIRFNVRYYFFALLFVLFDVEVAFFYPWATAFLGMKPHYSLDPDTYGVPVSYNFGFAIYGEMMFFIFLLVVAWVYAWRRGYLKWE